MNVSCPECASIFRVDPSKVTGRGVRARCSICGGIIAISAPSVDEPQLAAREVRELASVAATAAPNASATPTPPAPALVVEPPTPFWNSPDSVPATRFSPAPAASPEPQAASAVPVAPPPRTRPLNPYLANDPAQKARRLARALVSDLVAYHPQRREEGLRSGSLKQLFRDEIRKSYEEYAEQVGRELAESTPYFRDALNDVLAGGRKVF